MINTDIYKIKADINLITTESSYNCLYRFNTQDLCNTDIIVTKIHPETGAATHDFQQCGILTSVDSHEPVQPPFKLRNSKSRSVSSLTLIEYSSD